MNSKTESWRPKGEEADPDDPEDNGGPDSPVVPRNGVVEPDVGIRGVQEDLGEKCSLSEQALLTKDMLQQKHSMLVPIARNTESILHNASLGS